MEGFLYLLVPSEGVAKVGRTVDVERRIREYRHKSAQAVRAALCFSRVWGPASDIVLLERRLLRAFGRSFEVHEGREYFVAGAKEATDCFDAMVGDMMLDGSFAGSCPMAVD
jgi:hypothetical protein